MYCQCCILQILIFLDERVGKLRLTSCHKILLAHFLFIFIFFVFHRRKKEETIIQKIHRCNVVKKPKKETIRLIDIELSQIIKVFTWPALSVYKVIT